MALIVAARFNTFDHARDAAGRLMAAGVMADDLFTFYVNPADGGRHGVREDPASGGALAGAAILGLVGACAGAILGFAFGATAIGIVGGAGVGAYIGSLIGALRTLGRRRGPYEKNPPPLEKSVHKGRPSGVLLAVHVAAEDELRIARMLRDAGGEEVERAHGRWADGAWQDFDPIERPEAHPSL